MAQPVGNELVAAIGVSATGYTAATTEYFTAQQIANLAQTGATAARVVASGASDTSKSSDGTILWNSSTASAKSESIPAPTTLGRTLTIADNVGNAGTYNITITPVSGPIDKAATYVISVNSGSVTLIADGVSNWKSV